MVELMVILFCIAIYWYPTMAAFGNRHNDRFSILLVNLFFGWTGIGWIVAVIWAVSGNREDLQSLN